MSEKVYRLETGQCTCVLGDPVLGSQRVPVLKLGGAAVVIASSLPLQKNQFVYTSVNLEGGPALALSGVVVSSNAEGVLIRWTHHDPAEGRRVEQAIREHLRKAGRSPSEVEEEVNLPAEPPRPAPVKGARPPTESRAPGRSPPPGKPPEKPPERGGKHPEPHSPHQEKRGRHEKPPHHQEKPAGHHEKAAGPHLHAARHHESPAPHHEKAAAHRERPAAPEEKRAHGQEKPAAHPARPPEVHEKPAHHGGPAAHHRKPAHEQNAPAHHEKPVQHDKKPAHHREEAARDDQKPASSPVPPGGSQDPGLDDVAETIRRKARTVRSADLASRLETVQVLDMQTIRSLIKEAVDESAALLGASLAEAEKKRLLEEAEENFQERVQAFQAQKADLEEKTSFLQKQLEKARALLEGERGRILSAQQFTVSDKGMVELEQRLGRMLDFAIQKGEVTRDFEEEMRAVVVRLLDDERKKIGEKAQEAQNDKIALLEKKVQRLASSLESAEEERDSARRLAQALEAAGGVPLKNILNAGMAEDDPDRERKLRLLEEIVRLNKEMRAELAAVGRLPPPRVRAPEKGPEVPEDAGPTSLEKEVPKDPGSTSWEEEMARSLGVEKAEPEGAAKEVDLAPPPAVQNLENADTDKLEVFGAAPEVDPDDLPWQPPAPTRSKSSRVKIKRLGG